MKTANEMKKVTEIAPDDVATSQFQLIFNSFHVNVYESVICT